MKLVRPLSAGLLLLCLGAAGDRLPLTPEERTYLDRRAPLRLCVDPDYPPFDFVEAGRHRGIAADYMAEVSELIGVPVQLIPTPNWEQSLMLARRGECDLLPLLNQTPGRSAYLDFTRPYMVTAVAIVSRDRQYYDGLASLNGRTVALPSGYRFTEVISTQYPNIRILPVPTLTEALRAVSRGDADATLDNQQRLMGEVLRMGLDNLNYAGDAGLVDEFRIGVRKGDPILLGVMNRAVAQVPPERLREIMQRWYVVPVEPRIDWRMVLTTVAVAAGVVSMLLLHFYHRRRFYQLLEAKNHQLEHLSETDTLTGIGNRRKIDTRISEEIERARRHRHPFSVILYDIDRFKEINDSLGHPMGDRVIVELVELTRKVLRASDVLGRWGGEEFVVLCPETTTDQAEILAERLRARVEVHIFAGDVRTTISAGVTSLEASDTAPALLSRVDGLLYRAKASGRNRVAASAAPPAVAGGHPQRSTLA